MGVDPAAGDRFELVTRHECHLCDEMEAVLMAAGLTFASLDVDADPRLAERFGDVVPVLLRAGRPVAKIRLTRRELARIVSRHRR